MTDEEYLNAVQAAEYLKISKQRIYELRNAGRIGRQMGGYWLFTKRELDEYQAQKGTRKAGRPKGSRSQKIDSAAAL
jgi:excisionase family DNA binding protein